MSLESKTGASQLGLLSSGRTYLPEEEGLLVIHRVEAIRRHHACAELLPNRVGGQAVHVHFNVSAHLLVRQKLAGNHLQIRSTNIMAHYHGNFFNNAKLELIEGVAVDTFNDGYF